MDGRQKYYQANPDSPVLPARTVSWPGSTRSHTFSFWGLKMTSDNLENLVGIGQLKKETPCKRMETLEKAAERLRDFPTAGDDHGRTKGVGISRR